MELLDIKELIRALSLELVRYKRAFVLTFISISGVIVFMGAGWPQTYETSAVLHVDETNILEPLLRGRAEVGRVDRTNEAREIIYNRQFLEKVIEEAGLMPEPVAPEKIERRVKRLRGTIKIMSLGSEYFRLTYPSSSAEESYQVLNATMNIFIDYTNKKKKEESYSAYQFIDSQVQAYKNQLEDAEQKLKVFKSTNTDGTEAGVANRVGQLRAEIEGLGLAKSETTSRLSALRKQLTSESSYLKARSRLETLDRRKRGLTEELESLRLTYQDNYPDIVSIKAQIEEIRKTVERTYEEEGIEPSFTMNDGANPLYEELRIQLSVAEVDLRTQTQRINSLNKLLSNELVRAEKVASNEAKLTELTRDYDVTQGVYEEMLGRKENARLSMVLDIEGQGVSYQIHEPAVYPLQSIGLKFIQFAVIAPIVGLIVPFGAVFAFIFLDPRLRSSKPINRAFNGTRFIIDVPYCYSALGKRIMRRDILVLILTLVVFFAAYIGFIYNRLYMT
ncbi:XrtA system polysaccharide chain length determinant [Teredinibacter purpureus]|uniref:XrtA system polysaccharide chain length determinant n=1 Tax=Teredinibacter purpureus TaxID=2731756 RepID=UPI0005F81EC6|nr:XrtA system polysaccharide chain length determinant [Teredinibacter purpureus]